VDSGIKASAVKRDRAGVQANARLNIGLTGPGDSGAAVSFSRPFDQAFKSRSYPVYADPKWLNGRPFRMCKFRTMFVLEDGPIIQQATKDDPRVTWFGRLLRRTNLDELPQLFNVIAGQMSLVGPRPHAAVHNSEYERLVANYAYRYHVKPGITGWAQINGFRGETRTLDLMEKRVELDRWYIENWSYWLDLKIILRTLVLGLQPNAY
jgi:lipopolysaccharide/colanic/teichoic acid biosynthesis glycosyltransferase